MSAPDFSKFAGDRRWVKLDKTQTLPSDIATIFTDGACKNNPHGPGGWGWWRDEGCWAAGGFAIASNNIAELTAIHRVLTSAPADIDLAIVSDSEYAVMAVSVWATGWKRRGWRKTDGLPVENLALIQEAHGALLARTARTYFKRVRGHGRDASMLPAHVIGNEHADRLACEAKERSIEGDSATFGPGWITAQGPVPDPCERCDEGAAATTATFDTAALPQLKVKLCPECTGEVLNFLTARPARLAS